MTLKAVLASLALTILPAVSYAMCAGHVDQAQSCAPGTVWDAATETCVDKVSS